MAAEAKYEVLVAPGGETGALKVLFSALASGVDAVPVTTVKAGEIPFGQTVGLRTGSSVLAGANAASRFFALSAGVLDASNLAGDQWIEWEESIVQPLLAELAATPAAGSAKAALQAAFAELEAHLTAGGPFVTGAEAALADVVVFASLSAAFAGNLVDQAAVPKVAAYFTTLSARGDAQAASKLASAIAFKSLAPPESNASIKAWLEEAFTQAINAAYPAAEGKGITAQVVSASKFKHHYQCNSVMKVAAILRTGDRIATAQNIIDSVPANTVIDRLEAVKPGFINIYLSKTFLEERVKSLLVNGIKPAPVEPKRVVVDYSSPNIAKEMHVGHLRSTIIGDTIARILEYLGHDVIRINHVGDWGTQFGMLIAHLKDCAASTGEAPSIQELNAFYKAAKVRYDAEPEFNRRAHEETVKLQAGDEENLRLWKSLCKRSEEMFSQVYARLGIDERLEIWGESKYNKMIPGVLAELEGKGLLEDSEGARVMFCRPRSKPPLMVVKGDGGVGYDSTDLTCLWHRVHNLKAQWLLYVVDAGQADHFENVFAGAKKAGWTDGVRVEHVKFGVVQGEDGKKFKTRSGDTVRLVDLLDKARDLSLAELQSRVDATEGSGTLVAEEDLRSTAEKLGYGGVKYFDLRQNRTSDYKFSYKKMLARNGDTAVYMQYAHARIASMARKAGVDPTTLDPSLVDLEHQSAVDLAYHIAMFQEVVSGIQDDVMPHHLCEYLFKLANQFSDFYSNCRVVGDPKQNSRLLLCHATALVVRQCMELLGINPIDRL